jgi:hypothetical protein
MMLFSKDKINFNKKQHKCIAYDTFLYKQALNNRLL